MNTTQYSQTSILERALALKSFNIYSFFRIIAHHCQGSVILRGQDKKLVMIGSNNYLGLTEHPYVKEMSIKAIEKYGTGCTGSRFLNGNYEIHEELEHRLARFCGRERVIVYATGMQANLGSISALARRGDLIFSDSENHASIIDAFGLSRATAITYPHDDMNALEDLLILHASKQGKRLIVSDGVFSMTGKICDLPALVQLSKKYRCELYIDDAHGVGVLGPRGEGTPAHFNLIHEVDFHMGTFSKSFASIGGFLAGDADAIDYVKHSARSFMFSAALSPSAVGTVIAVLDLIENDPSILCSLWKNTKFISQGLEALGFYTYGSQTPIIPIRIGEDMIALKVVKWLEEQGIFATAVIPPAVPRGEALIRTSYMATHSRSDLEFCLEVFKKMKRQFAGQLTLQQGQQDQQDQQAQKEQHHQSREHHEIVL